MTTKNEQLFLSLRGLGFSANEVLVFLAVLELGPNTIWEIAQKSGVKRTTCYSVLEDLCVKGFASKTNDGRRDIYSVVSPKQLLRLAEYRYDRLVANVNQMEALASRSTHKPKIQLFEGAEGVRQVFNLMLELPKKSEFLMIGTNLITQSGFGDITEEFIRKRKERRLHSRAIFPDLPFNREFMRRDQGELRQTRLLPSDKFIPHKLTYIVGDIIADITHLETESFTAVIQSLASAWDEKQKFEFLWGLATRPIEVKKKTQAEESDEEKFEETGVE